VETIGCGNCCRSWSACALGLSILSQLFTGKSQAGADPLQSDGTSWQELFVLLG